MPGPGAIAEPQCAGSDAGDVSFPLFGTPPAPDERPAVILTIGDDFASNDSDAKNVEYVEELDVAAFRQAVVDQRAKMADVEGDPAY